MSSLLEHWITLEQKFSALELAIANNKLPFVEMLLA